MQSHRASTLGNVDMQHFAYNGDTLFPFLVRATEAKRHSRRAAFAAKSENIKRKESRESSQQICRSTSVKSPSGRPLFSLNDGGEKSKPINCGWNTVARTSVLRHRQPEEALC